MVSIEIVGNLGADVKRVDYNGAVFYSINVCDNRKVGEIEEITWYTCNLNNPSDELLPYLVKGQQVLVKGTPRYRIFDSAKAHAKMVGVEVFVNQIQLLGGNPQSTFFKPLLEFCNKVGQRPAKTMEEYGTNCWKVLDEMGVFEYARAQMEKRETASTQGQQQQASASGPAQQAASGQAAPTPEPEADGFITEPKKKKKESKKSEDKSNK